MHLIAAKNNQSAMISEMVCVNGERSMLDKSEMS